MCNDCEVDYEHVDIAREDFEQAQYFKGSNSWALPEHCRHDAGPYMI